MKKRKVKVSRILLLLALIIGLVFLISLLFVNYRFIGKKSIHEDANKYTTRSCLAFYPDSEKGIEVAKDICKNNKDNKIFDYILVPYGDYYLIDYGNGYSYYTDKDYKEVIINKIAKNEANIISDYLRYTIKKEHSDKYTLDFINDSYYENLDISNISYKLVKDNLLAYVPEYDIELNIPLKEIQADLRMDFGYPSKRYVRPTYINTNKPLLCLTFHGGPNFIDDEPTSTQKIVDTLYKYDCVGTFFVIGDNLEDYDWLDEDIHAFLIKSIRQANEYGSNQQYGNTYLSELSQEGITNAINGPVKYFKKYLNYDMKLYRPIGMDRDEYVDSVADLPAVLWNVDSLDSEYENPNDIYNQVINESGIDEGDIICFNDMYYETAIAIENIVPELIKEGYELVTVTDLMNVYKIDNNIDYIYDSTYYN